MDNPLPFSSTSSDSHFNSAFSHAEYTTWLQELRPRTCLLVHWLAGLQVVQDPGDLTHRKARRFADKRLLLGRILDNSGGEFCHKTAWLLENQEFDLYVTYIMWLRFNEYVPRRFVASDGRAKVLKWVRTQMGRPELTDAETLVELEWQIERIGAGMNEDQEWRDWFEA